MKIFLVCSKRFYDKIPPVQQTLEGAGHDITLPNSYENPGKEAEMREAGSGEHAQWKAEMLRHSAGVIRDVDAVLVLNFEKDGAENYIGGATFLEMYDAFRLGKKIFLHNPIPNGMLCDEIAGFGPVIINGDLQKIA